MKIIKFIIVFSLTFIGSLAIGLLLGACITGQSFAVVLDKFLSLSIVESVGIPLLSIFAMCLAAVVHVVLHEAGHLVAMFFCKGHPIAAVFSLMFVIVGAFLIIMNGIPMIVGGIPNDGMNALRLRKNATSRKAFALLLKSNAMATARKPRKSTTIASKNATPT